MCCLFGFHDYGHSLTRKQRSTILSVLSVACEERGTDATGIAYNDRSKLCIYKRPLPARFMWFRVPEKSNIVMGHTRMTTQGAEHKNYNNHPFPGNAGKTAFALAHNGVLHNDARLRRHMQLPSTKIETDSYIAVQLLERTGELSFESLRFMAEQLEGSFTFTVLSEKDDLYFVKGDNPMCIYHYPARGLYLYASTEEILKKALRRLSFDLGTPVRVDIRCGELLRIDRYGNMSRSQFDASNLFPRLYDPWADWPRFQSYTEPKIQEEYLNDLKAIAACHGLFPEDVDKLLADGFTAEDVEEYIYCGAM